MTKKVFSDWSQFDCEEYFWRNYAREILVEDQEIIKTSIARLKQIGTNATIQNYIDIGSGPNLYPSMLMAPLVSTDGQITLADYAAPNRQHLREMFADQSAVGRWINFETLMCEIGGSQYQSVIDRLSSRAQVKFGDIFTLDANQYDAISAFFVAESITDRFDEFIIATNSLLNSLKSGGIFLAAHMVGSRGWHAGASTNFPAVSLTVAQIQEVYKDEMNVSVDFFSHGSSTPARQGYEGMALAIGIRH